MWKKTSTLILTELLVLASLLVIIVIMGVTVYRGNAQKTYTAGVEAYLGSDCVNAVGDFITVSTFYRYASVPEIKNVQDKITECSLLIYAGNAYASQSYANAIIAYESYMTLYPGSAKSREITAQVGKIYYEWAASLVENKDYDLALQKYQILLQKYPGIYLPQAIDADIANMYSKWGEELRQSQKYQLALEKYRIILFNYPNTSAASGSVTETARIYDEWGEKLIQQGKYEEAVNNYKTIFSEYGILSQGVLSERANEGIARTTIRWGDALVTTGKYQEAVQVYQKALDEYPGTTYATSANDKMLQSSLDWMENLRKSGTYDQAIEMCGDIAKRWQGNPAAEAAKNKIPLLYFEWGNALKVQSDYAGAIEKYLRVVLSYPSSETAPDALDAIGNTYIEWGKQNIGKKQYWDALNKFWYGVISTQTASITSEAETNYRQALHSLAYDSEGQGRQFLENGLKDACNDQPPVLNIFDLDKDQPGRGLVCDQAFTLLDDLMATRPAQLRYIVIRRPDTSQIDTCYYRDGRLVRRRVWWMVIVKDAISGNLVDMKVFYGNAPDGCPAEHEFKSTVEYLDGTDPSLEPIYDWLREVFK